MTRKFLKYSLMVFSSFMVAVSLLILSAIFLEPPFNEEQFCRKEIEQGFYAQYADAMGRCVEDLWKAEAGIEVVILLALLLIIVFVPVFWIGLRLRLTD